jgi:hypothetical protein
MEALEAMKWNHGSKKYPLLIIVILLIAFIVIKHI